MAYVIPSLRMAPRPLFIPRAGARTSGAKTPTPSSPALDFQTLLNKQPAAALAAAAVPRTMGTITAGTSTAGTTTVGTATPAVASSIAPVVASPVAPGAAMAPSAQSLFGANPWISDAGGKGPNGGYSYNRYYFATPETGAKVAQMMGGKLVAANAITPFGPFLQNQPNQLVQMPDGRLINAGIIASYYDHGWSQQAVDRLVNGEIANIPT